MTQQYPADLPRADELMSMREAFQTSQRFIEMFWERGLKQNDELAMLLSSMEPAPWSQGAPLDIAQWHDFLTARDDVARSSS